MFDWHSSVDRRTVVGASLAIAFAAAAAPASAETLKLTAAAAAPPLATAVKVTKDTILPEISRRVAASGKGLRIEWNEAWASTLAKPTEIFEAVESGIAHVGIVLKNFEESNLPLEGYTYMAPFSEHTVPQMIEIDGALRKSTPEFDQAYRRHNQVYLVTGVGKSMNMFTTFPIRSVDDLKGRKIGASGTMGHYLRGTGAVVVNSAMLESYSSIKNGLYDGYPISVVLAFPFRTYQATKYYTEVHFGANTTTSLTINKMTWDKLPGYVRKIFQDVMKDWPHLQDKMDSARHNRFVGIMKKQGVQFSRLPASERKRWANMMPNIAKEWAKNLDKRGLPGTKVLKMYMEELRARDVRIQRHWDRS